MRIMLTLVNSEVFPPAISLHAYACRGVDGALLPIPSGKTRQETFCKYCLFGPWRSEQCLFAPSHVKEMNPKVEHNVDIFWSSLALIHVTGLGVPRRLV